MLFINFGPRTKPVFNKWGWAISFRWLYFFYYMRWAKLRINFSSFFFRSWLFLLLYWCMHLLDHYYLHITRLLLSIFVNTPCIKNRQWSFQESLSIKPKNSTKHLVYFSKHKLVACHRWHLWKITMTNKMCLFLPGELGDRGAWPTVKGVKKNLTWLSN